MATKKAAAEEASSALTLGDLRPAKGATKNALRVGRGRASGAGKTCNRGHNGEGQRSGNSTKRGFEGGQMPGYRRMPKIKRMRLVNPRVWISFNVGDLDGLALGNETEITYKVLAERGYLKPYHDGVRILGNGEMKRKLTIEAHYVTPGAQKKIEAAGSKVAIQKN